MTTPIASSSSSSFDPFDQLCLNVKNEQITNIEDVKNYVNLVQIIKNGIESHKNDETCKQALGKLMKICEGDKSLHDTISTICKNNGIFSRSSLFEKCKNIIDNVPGTSVKENENGILKITITETNEQTDRFFEFISKLEEDENKRGLIIDLKPNATQTNKVIEKYGKHANSLTLVGDCIRDNNHFEELIQNCANLNHLFIKSDQITVIAALPQLAALQTLNCSGCRNLTALPKLAALQTLHCSYCSKLTALPQLAALQTLHCSYCSKLTALPQLAALQTLTCSSCIKLTALPQLAALQTLTCSYCRNLTALPQLAALQTLNCSWCIKLTALPKLAALQTLDCSYCSKLTALPQLAALQTLDCSRCDKLTALPQLAALQTLDCSRCDNLTALPQLAALQTLNCALTPIEGKYYLFNCFLRYCKPNVKEDVSWAGYSGKNIYDYFNARPEVKKNRQWMFNDYPLLFEIISDLVMDPQGIKIPDQLLEEAIDGGNLINEQVADHFGIPKNKLQKVLQKVPFSENEGMRSSLIIKIIGECKINPDSLPDVPKGFYFDENPSEKSISLLNQQQVFCDLLSGCVRLAEDLGFKFDRNNPDAYPKFLIKLIKTTIDKKSDWEKKASDLPLELRKMTQQRSVIKDAVDDYIKTVALAHYIRQHPAFDLKNNFESFRLSATERLLKGVSIDTIVKFSDAWHTEGRRAQLNKAKSFSNEVWEPLFSPDTVKYPDDQGRLITAVPLTTTADLKEEGDVRLKHCVAGYGTKCLIENCHIISLRDEKGNSLSTIDLRIEKGVGDGNNPWVINIKGRSDYHLKCNQHYGFNNSPPSADCKKIEEQLFKDIREGRINVELSVLEGKRQIRFDIMKSPDKLKVLLVGYDPSNQEEFEKAKEIYRNQLSMMGLKSRSIISNFKKLIEVSPSQASSSNDRSFFV